MRDIAAGFTCFMALLHGSLRFYWQGISFHGRGICTTASGGGAAVSRTLYEEPSVQFVQSSSYSRS